MSAVFDDQLGSDDGLNTRSKQPFPNSRKIYEPGTRPDVQVPFREIALADTHTADGILKNPPVYVYDTSGPYTDPEVAIDVRSGFY